MTKVTQWFDKEKPVHVGAYQVKGRGYGNKNIYMAYWNGDFWGVGVAVDSYLAMERSMFQDRTWRGLAEKPA